MCNRVLNGHVLTTNSIKLSTFDSTIAIFFELNLLRIDSESVDNSLKRGWSNKSEKAIIFDFSTRSRQNLYERFFHNKSLSSRYPFLKRVDDKH